MSAEELVEILKSIQLPNCPIAFSGGLDSAILAALSDSPLYSIGLKDSYDLQNSKKVAQLLDKKLTAIEASEADVAAAIPEVQKLVGNGQLDIEIGIPFYFLLKRTPKEHCLILGQGADELFGGYKRYEAMVGTPELEAALEKDAAEVMQILERRELRIAAHFNTTMHFPYLDQQVVEFANSLPAHEKVAAAGRKLVLRGAGKLLGLPEEVYSQPKKAIQYGTGISKLVKKNLKEIGSS